MHYDNFVPQPTAKFGVPFFSSPLVSHCNSVSFLTSNQIRQHALNQTKQPYTMPQPFNCEHNYRHNSARTASDLTSGICSRIGFDTNSLLRKRPQRPWQRNGDVDKPHPSQLRNEIERYVCINKDYRFISENKTKSSCFLQFVGNKFLKCTQATFQECTTTNGLRLPCDATHRRHTTNANNSYAPSMGSLVFRRSHFPELAHQLHATFGRCPGCVLYPSKH